MLFLCSASILGLNEKILVLLIFTFAISISYINPFGHSLALLCFDVYANHVALAMYMCKDIYFSITLNSDFKCSLLP